MTKITTAKRPITVITTVLGLVAIVATAGTYANRTKGDGGSARIVGNAFGGNEQAGLPAWLIENLLIVIVAGSIAIAVLIVVGTIIFRGREGLEQLAHLGAQLAIAAVAAAVFWFGAAAILRFFSGGPAPAGGPPGATPGGSAIKQGPSNAAGSGDALPSLVGFIAIMVAMIIVGHFLLQRGANDDDGGGAPGAAAGAMSVESEDASPAEPTIDIDDVPRTNAVYRAWHEMASRAVDASDRTATASEIAGAAVRSGFDRQAVDRLTELFEEVRYGGRPVTDDRERAAEDALDALEGSGEARA